MTIMYYRASTFDIVISVVIEIALIVVGILILRIFYRRIARSEVPPEVRNKTKGIDISAVLFILLSLPFLLLGGFTLALGVLFSLGYGVLGVMLVLFSLVPVFLGFLILFVGIGLWRMNYSAWKGSMILSIIVMLFMFPSALSYITQTYMYLDLFYFFLFFGTEFLSMTPLPIIMLVISTGLFIYLYQTRPLFKAVSEHKIPARVRWDERENVNNCPVCNRTKEPDTKMCPFCGYKFD